MILDRVVFSKIEKWRSFVLEKNSKRLPVISICGPSGVGKTTIIQTLSKAYPAYVENASENPHLSALLKGSLEFDAAANQRWFLDRISNYIRSAATDKVLILDQDPAAIVFAYANMFLESGKIQTLDYASLQENLLDIEKSLWNWRSPRTVIFLDAPADVLFHRIFNRQGNSLTPAQAWFEEIRIRFRKLSEAFPNKFLISTEHLSLEQSISEVRKIVENEIKQA